MNIKMTFGFIVILVLSFWQSDLCGQTSNENERTIYLMRAKQSYGSSLKMDLMINGELFHKIKSGNRLIIKTNSSNTLDFQIFYPTIFETHKSQILKIVPDSESEVYIDLYYWGGYYNPLKHSGVLRGPIGESPEFNIAIIKMTKEEGVQKFNLSKKFKDNKLILEKRLP